MSTFKYIFAPQKKNNFSADVYVRLAVGGLMQKTCLFFMQIGMPQANALILGKSATVFYPGDRKLLKLAADLPNLFCDRYLAFKYPATVHLPHCQ
jgi:hypothetical protein